MAHRGYGGGGGYHSPRGGYYSPRGGFYGRGYGGYGGIGGLGAGLAIGALAGTLAAPYGYGGYGYGGYYPPPVVYNPPPTIIIPTSSSGVAELAAANPGMSIQFVPTNNGYVSPRSVASPIYYR